MIELPEAINLAKQMRETVRGKTVSAVYPPSSPHKFCWFNHEPEEYQAFLAGHTVTGCAHIASHICVKRGIDKNLPLARQWARY